MLETSVVSVDSLYSTEHPVLGDDFITDWAVIILKPAISYGVTSTKSGKFTSQ